VVEKLWKILLVLFWIVALEGCATTANYEAKLQSWIGHSESELIASWGPPSNSYTSGEVTSLAYGGSNGAVIYNGAVIPVNCTTTFTLVNHVVTNWTWKGNSCKSK
jgi:hypothetical protein